jgi:hypothetical protein
MQNFRDPNINTFDKYSILKYGSYLPDRDLPIIQTLQNDNLFIKKKLTELEDRLNRRNKHYACEHKGK